MKLTFGDRFRLAWELTWPLALIDLGVVVLIHGAFDVRGEVLDTKFLRRGMMPEGLLDTMTPQQVSDLFAYLMTLK